MSWMSWRSWRSWRLSASLAMVGRVTRVSTHAVDVAVVGPSARRPVHAHVRTCRPASSPLQPANDLTPTLPRPHCHQAITYECCRLDTMAHAGPCDTEMRLVSLQYITQPLALGRRSRRGDSVGGTALRPRKYGPGATASSVDVRE